MRKDILIHTFCDTRSDRCFSLHHTRLPAYMREMKKYHLAHHYKNFELGFGVTSASLLHDMIDTSGSPSFTGKIWDVVFNTELYL